MKKPKRRSRPPSPFTYKSRHKEITGSDDSLLLILLCYIDSLRWLVWPLLVVLIAWLRQILSG